MKREIVSMGVEGIDPKETTGTRVDPDQWNNLISDPEVLVIDIRNNYEIGIGTFKEAVNPNTKSFRENLVCQQDNLHKSMIENALGFIAFYVIAILFIAFLFQLSQKKFNSKEKKNK